MSVSIKPFFCVGRGDTSGGEAAFVRQTALLGVTISTSVFLTAFASLADGRNPMVSISSASLETKDSSLSSKAEFLVPGFERLTATRERPLFTPARHQPLPPPPSPPVQQVETPPPPPAPPPTLSLLGTVLSADPKEAFAVVKGSDSSKTRRVIIGDEIENWKISHIQAQEIVLSLDERSVTIKLSTEKPAASIPRPFVAPPPFPVNGRPDMRARRFNGLPAQPQ